MAHSIRVNGRRLWDSIMEIAEIGAIPGPGSCRLTLTKEDQQARDLFCQWCKEAGCEVVIDRAGNIFATRPGRNTGAPVATGSHLDTQPHGGRFDGVYGVLAGLEVIRTLNDLKIETEDPVTVINWTNEEGVRYPHGLLGSSAYAGVISLPALNDMRSIDGARFEDNLRDIGYSGTIDPGNFKMSAYFEAHIEQGPVLEQQGLAVGIVPKVQGLRWFRINVAGEDNHAGTVPMDSRKDSFAATAQIAVKLEQMALEYPDIRFTIGKVDVEPNAPGTIPGKTEFRIDLRHPDEAVLEEVEGKIRHITIRTAEARGLTASVERVMEQAPLEFNGDLLGKLKRSVESLNMPYFELPSGAVHDAIRVAPGTPAAMLFIPCRGGISHNEAEYAEFEHCEAGANVLAGAIVTQAKVIQSFEA